MHHFKSGSINDMDNIHIPKTEHSTVKVSLPVFCQIISLNATLF